MTNHVIVAMVGPDVKQTRCSTCDAEHEYKHAKVPRQRRKSEAPAALYSQVLAGAPKRHGVADAPPPGDADHDVADAIADTLPQDATSQGNNPEPVEQTAHAAGEQGETEDDDIGQAVDPEDGEDDDRAGEDEGPVHRPLIRASLPRQEGQAPPARALPDFTIRQPGGRANRFRPRHQRGGGGFGGGQTFQGNRSNGNTGGGGPSRGGGMPRQGAGGSRPPMMKRHGGSGGGRKRSK